MLKTSAILGTTYTSKLGRYHAGSLVAALLDGLFEHPDAILTSGP
jgi:hypothetical protein